MFGSFLNYISYYVLAKLLTGDANTAVTQWDKCHAMRMESYTQWAATQVSTDPGAFGYPEDLTGGSSPLVSEGLLNCMNELTTMVDKLANAKRIDPATCNPNRMCLVFTKKGVRSILFPQRVYDMITGIQGSQAITSAST